MQRVFTDPALQAAFEREGFVVVRLLSTEAAADLRARIDETRNVTGTGESCSPQIDQSFCNTNGEFRRRMDLLCGEAIEQPLLALIPGYRLLGTGVMIKKPGAGPMDIHRDRTILQDLNTAPVAAWCPLVDIDDSYGNLSLLPGSHTLGNIETPGLPRFYAGYGDKLKQLCVSQPLRAGEAVLFDYRLLHWAMPNRHDRERPVLRSTAVPINSRTTFFKVEESSGGRRLEVFDITDVGDHSPAEMDQVLLRAQSLGFIDNPNRDIGFEECQRRASEAGDSKPLLQAVTDRFSKLRGLVHSNL